MDYSNVINKDTLREILSNLAPIPQNDALSRHIAELLAAKTIQAIPYTYSAVYAAAGAANSLAAGALNVPFNVNIQADADFLILNQTYVANTLNAAQTRATSVEPLLSVLLTDTGSGYQYMDRAVPVPSIFGNGQFPYVLPEPKLLAAKATLQVLATNFDAAAGYNLWLSFNGVKLFAYQ